jgi:hypothetical protein
VADQASEIMGKWEDEIIGKRENEIRRKRDNGRMGVRENEKSLNRKVKLLEKMEI